MTVEKIYYGKTVLIFGLGRFGGGLDSARFAYNCGASVIVTDSLSEVKLATAIKELADCKDITYRLGSHDKSDFEKADIIIVNPAVPPTHEMLAYARSLGKTITSQVEIFFGMCPARIAGITGANGKSPSPLRRHRSEGFSVPQGLAGRQYRQPAAALRPERYQTR
jgi:UDP-N-acetylmuramoylalanine--D-glutamate ligase